MSGTSGASTTSGMYSLKWNHYHSYLTTGLSQLLDDAEYSMTDVTLACEGQFVQAHKIVLTVCSPFFKQLFRVNRAEKGSSMVVVLTNVKFRDVQNILQFIYNGQVNVGTGELNNFLKAAEILQIQGLAAGDAEVQNGEKDTMSKEVIHPATGTQEAATPRIVSSSSRSFPTSEPPPLKRSRLSVSNSSNTTHSTPPQTSVSSSLTQCGQPTPSGRFGSTSSSSSPVIMVNSTATADPNSQASTMTEDYDPLDQMDEGAEEMISMEALKTEPIAVYTLDDNNSRATELGHGNDNRLETGNSSDGGGVLYEFEDTIDHSNTDDNGPGPSSAMARSRMTAQPKPTKSAASFNMDGILQETEGFQVRCKTCGISFPSESFQTHGCFNIKKSQKTSIGVVEPVKCGLCGRTFKNRNSFKVHKSTYHRSKGLPVPRVSVSSGIRLNCLAEVIPTSSESQDNELLFNQFVKDSSNILPDYHLHQTSRNSDPGFNRIYSKDEKSDASQLLNESQEFPCEATSGETEVSFSSH